MRDFFVRSLMQLLDRAGGPMHLRFVLRPVTAAVIAIRAGVRDSRSDSPAYLGTLLPTRRYAATFCAKGFAMSQRRSPLLSSSI